MAEWRVGPKGYIHNWIFVGAPGVGAHVFHPQHGHGTVTAHNGQQATVKFHSGAEHSFEARPGKGPAELRPRPESQDAYKTAQQRLSEIPGLLGVGGQIQSPSDRRLAAMIGDIQDELSMGPGSADWGYIRGKMAALQAAEQDAAKRGQQGNSHARELATRLSDLRSALEALAPAGEHRTAETPVASTVHEPVGNPAGPGLWHHKGMQLPAYIQHVANRLRAEGHGESNAVQMAVGIVKNWAEGHDGHGNQVSGDVQAAAVKAVAEWEALKAAAHASSGRSAPMAHVETRAKYTAAQKQAMAAKGQAMKNASGEPSYPIADEADLSDAIRAVGRGGSSHDTIRKHIISRAKALGKSSMIPDNWNPDGSLQSGSDSDADEGRAVRDQAERRVTPAAMEIRTAPDGAAHIGGYAAVFGKLSRNLGGFVEKVGDTAFNQSRQLGWPGVKCRLNHDKNQLLGTTEGRTLLCRIDNIGLDYEVEPPPSMRNVVEWVQRGDISTSSFAFNCPPGGDEWRTSDQGYPLRILHEVQLLDVAPVTEGEAYADATVGLRSLAAAMDAPFEEVRQLAAEDELRRFFARTDRPSRPKPPPISGPAAMMKLMEKRRDPWADQDV